MKRVLTCWFALGIVAVLASMVPQAVAAADGPAAPAVTPSPDRVVVMYFHRTQRCPTCLKMGSYSEEAVKTGFVKQIKEGKVEFHYIDFQNEKNQALTKAYKISGPTLMVARVAGNKVAEYKNLTEIWAKVREKPAFIEYVRTSVKGYQK